ncbi:hypothetical protein EDB81DRAFT_894678 [Dactylonectria macrodidyma]|uniref:Uncharacterized protein n=1 Tax=Dactylonectria macrodidyma TaxID=307937 RepID=A0A9P9D1H8_9HYPO|nr:hypothetical protein EDB81DRAFT_894678 [Dactylonectria macrodidyma]
MDPLSITASCLELLTAVGKATLAITDFVRGCCEARSDLIAVTAELSLLQLVLELLKDDAAVSGDRVIPESLRAQILSIVAAGDIPPTARGQNFVLQQYLDSLTSYAETVCNDVERDFDGSIHATSRPEPR